MAARLWRCILGLTLAAAAVSGAWMARAYDWSMAGALSTALGFLLAIPVAVVFLSFVIAQAAAHEVYKRGSVRELGWTFLKEIAEFIRALLAMSAPAQPRPAPQPPVARSDRPVVLLHGFLCNGRVWTALQARLHAAGFGPIEAPDVEPLLADIETQARRVAPELLALQSRCNGERVVIIAHSMGGLVARALLRDLGAGAIRRIVTIASPHHGTLLVHGLPWPNTRQMSDASPWLRALNSAQEGRFTVPVASIYGVEDNLVVPAGSARLQGAEMHELRGIGHFGMLRARGALDRVIATLQPEILG